MSLIIEIKDKKAMRVLQRLKDEDLIDFSEGDENIVLKEQLQFRPKNNSKDESFFDLAGIWKDRNITVEKIRNRAWPKRK